MTPEVKALLQKQGYRIVGRHSAVKLCHWLRERLLRKRSCYKAKFYGIASHRCLQMTPSVAWCQHSCLFCWRPVEHTLGEELRGEVDEPEVIVEGALEAQRSLLSGYGGEKERVTEQEFREALSPKHVAISLAGEPTNYPRIAELVEEFSRRGMSTFLVTNGMHPERIYEVRPTSLYLSLIAPNEEVYRRINVPRVRDGWRRLMQSLEAFGASTSRRVVRITLVRGYNLEHPEAFAPLIERAEPDFIEAKGYVHVGYSRRRLSWEHMPTYEEVGDFAKALAEATGYEVADSSRDSKVFLLRR
ncbi:MAG: 4-demethylwyosine synthase TYW1 [Euryarchaeota archaeon]|nr:4-demethylwyosine synthase TYW1 [Euryarchaeota archaeon]